jgi:hypothetical protein
MAHTPVVRSDWRRRTVSPGVVWVVWAVDARRPSPSAPDVLKAAVNPGDPGSRDLERSPGHTNVVGEQLREG